MGGLKQESRTTRLQPVFPHKISRRLLALSQPRKYYVDSNDDIPPLTKTGTRVSAISGRITDKSSDLAWPYLRRLILLKRMYKNKFSKERLERIDRMIESSNATVYSKLANCAVDLKRQEQHANLKKRRGWSETEWKKRMEYISQMAAPRKVFEPTPVKRGKSKPLDDLMPRINEISTVPDLKRYRRMSQEAWFRNPEKVAPKALKYVITERIKKLATPKAAPPGE